MLSARDKYQTQHDRVVMSNILGFLKELALRRGPVVETLKLYVPVPAMRDQTSHDIIASLNVLKIKDLHVEVLGCSCNKYSVPEINPYGLLKYLSTTSLTTLRLNQCHLDVTSSDTFTLSSLRELSLDSVWADQRIVDILISKCTSLETLRVSDSWTFPQFTIPGLPKLRLLHVCDSFMTRIEIDAPNLRELSLSIRTSDRCDLVLSESCQALERVSLFCGSPREQQWVRDNQLQLSGVRDLNICGCIKELKLINTRITSLQNLSISHCIGLQEVDLRSCGSLKCLNLKDCNVTNEWLNQQLEELNRLEVLTLGGCFGSVDLVISSCSLRTLITTDCPNLTGFDLNLPNLHEFRCSTTEAPRFFMSTVLPARVHLGLKATAIVSWDSQQHKHLMRFLDKCRMTSLYIEPYEVTGIPDNLKLAYRPPTCQFDHLTLLLPPSVVRRKNGVPLTYVDDLLWLFPRVKNIHIMDASVFQTFAYTIPFWPSVEKPISILLKLSYKEAVELGQYCCECYASALSTNCWRHSLKDFEIKKHSGLKDDGSLRKFLEDGITDTK